MWQRWYKNQCVAVGWPPPGYSLQPGRGIEDRAWTRARNAITAIEPGDFVAVALQGNRLGRIGEVVSKRINDHEWAPLVPKDRDLPVGEMGRRILLRWDLANAPESPDQVVQLPPSHTFNSGELRSAVSRVSSQSLATLQTLMAEPTNWVGLLGQFGYEKALSDFIAAYPHRLEDGMLPYPNSKVRERTFHDRSRLDVLLIDRAETPVIVECKQHAPSVDAIDQLRHYMRRLHEETQKDVRGILVHGGARTLSTDVRASAAVEPAIEIVSYRLDVDFALCQ